MKLVKQIPQKVVFIGDQNWIKLRHLQKSSRTRNVQILAELSGVLQANVACGWPYIFENMLGRY